MRKNKAIYNVVSKTALLDIFKKNNVMVKTYFGELSPAPRWALDFSDSDTQQELINAEIFDATSWKAQTIYKRNNLMTFTPLELGIALQGNSGTSGRAEYRYTFPKAITDKVVTYETELKVQAPETPSYGSTTQLYANKIISSTNAVVASMEFSASNILLKALDAENTTVSYPEGTTAYSDLTIKIEFDLVTKNVNYYVNESLLGTLVSTGDDAAMINLSGSANSTVQNETAIVLYSADITVKEHEEPIVIEPITITFEDMEIGRSWETGTDVDLGNGVILNDDNCTATTIRENNMGYTDPETGETPVNLLRLNKGSGHYSYILLDNSDLNYKSVTIIGKATSGSASGTIKPLYINDEATEVGFDGGSVLYSITQDITGLESVKITFFTGGCDLSRITFNLE